MVNALESRNQKLVNSTSPLVSVMITSYNQKDVIARAIDSVLHQTYGNIQIVVADDASTDGSQELLRSFSEEYPGHFKLAFAKTNQGIAKNKNNGFRSCDGEFITYLDGDDYYFPEKIDRELEVFRSNPKVDIVYSNFTYADASGNHTRLWKCDDYIVPTGHIFEYVFSRNFPGKTLYRCELMRVEALKSIHYYDDSVIAYEDWDSRIRMSKKYYIAYSDYVGSAYVNDPRGISKVAKRKQLVEDMKYVIKKNKPLLRDLPLDKRYKILRDLEIIVTRKEISLQSSPFTLELFKYIILSGDLKITKSRIRKFLKLYIGRQNFV